MTNRYQIISQKAGIGSDDFFSSRFLDKLLGSQKENPADIL